MKWHCSFINVHVEVKVHCTVDAYRRLYAMMWMYVLDEGKYVSRNQATDLCCLCPVGQCLVDCRHFPPCHEKREFLHQLSCLSQVLPWFFLALVLDLQ